MAIKNSKTRVIKQSSNAERSTKKERPIRHHSTTHQTFVHEPKATPCKPKRTWRVRKLIDEMTASQLIEIRFRTEDNRRDIMRIENADRGDAAKVYRQLLNFGARLPHDKKEALAFVTELLRSVPATAVTLTHKPGFWNGALTYVQPNLIMGADRHLFVWNHAEEPGEWHRSSGTLEGYQALLREVGRSPYMIYGVLVQLAAPLPSYVRQRQPARSPIISETSLTHVVGTTTTGKTTLTKVASSVSGDPERRIDFDATDRGIAEKCHNNNDGVLLMDDSESASLDEKDFHAFMGRMGQRVPAGRSRTIAKMARSRGLPSLTWSCFALTNGPHSAIEYAHKKRLNRHGQEVRYFELRLPSPEEGGVLGTGDLKGPAKAGRRRKIMAAIDEGLSQHYGVLYPAWIKHLIDGDHCDRLREITDRFVKKNATDPKGRRLAEKFGVKLAAGMVAVEAGLLPWSKSQVRHAIQFCYDKALAAMNPFWPTIQDGLDDLLDATKSRKSFPVYRKGKNVPFDASSLGLKAVDGQKVRWYVPTDLPRRLSSLKEAEASLLDVLRRLEIVTASVNAKSTVQLRVFVDGKLVRMRFWRLSRARLKAVLAECNREDANSARPLSERMR